MLITQVPSVGAILTAYLQPCTFMPHSLTCLHNTPLLTMTSAPRPLDGDPQVQYLNQYGRIGGSNGSKSLSAFSEGFG